MNVGGEIKSSMPVRIYEIAKKLNLESKFVLNKAKELGIAAAKVPSSTLDKITAEFLEEQLAPLAKPFEAPKPVEVIPVAIIHAPAEPVPAAAPEPEPEPIPEPMVAPVVTRPVVTGIDAPVAEKPAQSLETVKAEIPQAPAAPVLTNAPELVESEVVAPVVAPSPEVPEPSVVTPMVSETVAPVHPELSAPAATTAVALPAPVAAQVTPPESTNPAPSPVSAPAAGPAPTPAPAPVQTGQLVGRIDLSQFGYGDARPAVSAPRRLLPDRLPQSPEMIDVVRPRLSQGAPVGHPNLVPRIRALLTKATARDSSSARVNSAAPIKWVDALVSPPVLVPGLSPLLLVPNLPPTLPPLSCVRPSWCVNWRSKWARSPSRSSVISCRWGSSRR